MCGERHRESNRPKTSALSPGSCKAHMVLSWYRGKKWHMNKTSPSFTVPVSSVPCHFSTSPSSVTKTNRQLTATYITLTNQRLLGFFLLSHVYQWHVPLPFRCTLLQCDLLHWKIWQDLCITCCFVIFSFLPVIIQLNFTRWIPSHLFLFCLPNLLSSPTTLLPFMVLRSRAYWPVTVEQACLRFCDVRNSMD